MISLLFPSILLAKIKFPISISQQFPISISYQRIRGGESLEILSAVFRIGVQWLGSYRRTENCQRSKNEDNMPCVLFHVSLVWSWLK